MCGVALNINDARQEFELMETVWGDCYELQQVYNGIPVKGHYISIQGDFIRNSYDDALKYREVDTTINYAEADIENIVVQYVINHYKEKTSVYNVDAFICENYNYVVYIVTVWNENSSYNLYVSALTGEVLSCNKADEIVNDDVFSISSDNKPSESGNYYISAEVSVNGESAVGSAYVDKEKNVGPYYLFNIRNRIGIYSTSRAEPATILPVDIYRSNTVQYPNTDINKSAIIGLKNFNDVTDTLNEVVEWTYCNEDTKDNKLVVQLSQSTNYQNACYSTWFGTDMTSVDFLFGYKNTINQINMLDTVGHEYGHFIQDIFIGKDYQLNNLSSAYSVPNSSDMQYVEHWAILEGTADIMGMLLEANIENSHLTNSSFLYYGEINSNINTADRNHTSDNTIGNQTISEMYEYYSSDLRVANVVVNNRCTIQGISYRAGASGPVYLESEQDINEIKNLINSGDITADFLAGNELPYGYGPGHRDIYILVGVLRNMIDRGNPKLQDAKIQLKLWFNSITKLKDEAQLIDIREAFLDYAKNIEKMDETTLDDIKKAFDSVGIIAQTTINSVVNKWYADSMTSIANMGILTNYIGGDGALEPTSSLNQQEYIQLVVDFCNESGANITYNYNNGVATLTKPIFGESSDESMSLIFDESKDILRWEAFIIAYRILNFCHEEFKANDWSGLYNYSYIDENSIDHYKAFYDYITNNGKNIEYNLPDVSAEDILTKYYDGTDYTSFAEQHFAVKNTSGVNTYYSFENMDVIEDNAHRIIIDAIYNMYRSLGKNLPVSVHSPAAQGVLLATSPLSNIKLTDKMTLADTCYLLYSFMK